MEITFVRTGGKHDHVYVTRTDGSETSWTFPTYGNQVPHDLVHLVVEAAFGLRNGIYAHVDRGIDMTRINEQANRLGGPKKYERQGLGAPDILVSEALAAGSWSFEEHSDEERVGIITQGCAAYAVSPPPSLSVDRITAARLALAALRERWRALGPKGSIRVSFDPSAPEQSFEQLQAHRP